MNSGCDSRPSSVNANAVEFFGNFRHFAKVVLIVGCNAPTLCVSLLLLFLFLWGDCERRGWYDNSQPELRPRSNMAQCSNLAY